MSDTKTSILETEHFNIKVVENEKHIAIEVQCRDLRTNFHCTHVGYGHDDNALMTPMFVGKEMSVIWKADGNEYLKEFKGRRGF